MSDPNEDRIRDMIRYEINRVLWAIIAGLFALAILGKVLRP